MFRVLVSKEEVEGLLSGFKPGEGANVSIVSVADYDAPPDDYVEYRRIQPAKEAAERCQDKGWKAKVVDEEGKAIA